MEVCPRAGNISNGTGVSPVERVGETTCPVPTTAHSRNTSFDNSQRLGNSVENQIPFFRRHQRKST